MQYIGNSHSGYGTLKIFSNFIFHKTLRSGCAALQPNHETHPTIPLHPERVRQCVNALDRGSGSVPVSVKCRLGTDERNGYDRLAAFVHTVSCGGVRHFAVHARECVLEGLNPAQVCLSVFNRVWRQRQ